MRGHIEMVGHRVGKLLVLRRAATAPGRGAFWVCQCDCGRETIVSGNNLRATRTRSCGCLRLADIEPGTRFMRLTAIDRQRGGRWQCRCDCGAAVSVLTTNLLSGNSGSCGCLSAELAGARRRTHGLGGTPEHRVWHAMRSRCHNPKTQHYKTYGGAGIRICERWRTSFEAFFADMGSRPTPRHSVDRIDNTRGYDCGRCDDCVRRGAAPNCRWATATEQSRNKRNNRHVTAFGVTRTLAEWAERAGVAARTIAARLDAGVAPERALTTPGRPRRQPVARTWVQAHPENCQHTAATCA